MPAGSAAVKRRAYELSDAACAARKRGRTFPSGVGTPAYYPGDGTDERAAEGAADAPYMICGVCWLDAADNSRPAQRVGCLPQGRRDSIGFRVVVTVESVK